MKAKKRDIWIDRIKVGKSRLQRAMYNELPCGGEKKEHQANANISKQGNKEVRLRNARNQVRKNGTFLRNKNEEKRKEI